MHWLRNIGAYPAEVTVSIICLIKGCEWMACPLQLPGMALMTCERCERCGALRYHSTVVQ